jgi:hypothetical protein
MSKLYLLCALLLVLAAAPLAAEEARLAGPVTGFVFDAEAHALRPMLGVPGGAYLGDSLASGLDFAAVAPDGKLALAVRDGKLFLVSGFETADLRWTELGAALEGVDQIVWNSTSSAAALANSAAGRVQRWSHLNATAESTEAVVLAGKVLALAVEASGTNAIAGVEGNGVYLLSSAVRHLSRMEQPVSIALAGKDLFVANQAAAEVFVLRNYADGGDATIFANESMGITDPVGLTLSADQKTLLVASGTGKSISAFDLTTASAPRQMELDFAPSRLAQFTDKALYVLNSAGKDPLQILDAGNSMNVYFVPTGAREE